MSNLESSFNAEAEHGIKNALSHHVFYLNNLDPYPHQALMKHALSNELFMENLFEITHSVKPPKVIRGCSCV